MYEDSRTILVWVLHWPISCMQRESDMRIIELLSRAQMSNLSGCLWRELQDGARKRVKSVVVLMLWTHSETSLT